MFIAVLCTAAGQGGGGQEGRSSNGEWLSKAYQLVRTIRSIWKYTYQKKKQQTTNTHAGPGSAVSKSGSCDRIW